MYSFTKWQFCVSANFIVARCQILRTIALEAFDAKGGAKATTILGLIPMVLGPALALVK